MRERDKGTARGAVTTGGHYDNMENKRERVQWQLKTKI